MTERRNFNGIERQAILLLEKLEREGRGVPRRFQYKLSAEELLSWFQADHYPIKWIDGGRTHPSNGQMLLSPKGARRLEWLTGIAQAAEHKEKTKLDVATLAKDRRIIESQAAFRSRILAKTGIIPSIDPERHRLRKLAGEVERGGKRKRPWPKRSMRPYRKPEART